jgi:hypothetical protein
MSMCTEFSFIGMLIYEIIWVLYSTNEWNLLASSWNTNVKNIFDVMVYKKKFACISIMKWLKILGYYSNFSNHRETTKNWSNYKQVNIIISF